MGGRSARVKGATFERKIANYLREWLEARGYEPTEDLKRGIGQTRQAHEVPDVAGFYPFWLEAKKHGVCRPQAALRQAETDMAEHARRHPDTGYLLPIAVTSDNRDEPIIAMRLGEFLEWFYAPWLAAKVRDQ